MKWAKVQLEGPPPASRLDFAACTVKLRVPLHAAETVGDIVGTSLQAGEVIGTQVRCVLGKGIQGVELFVIPHEN